MKERTFRGVEKLFFLMCVVLNLNPVARTRFFPTLDGAAHLHNSSLINHLITEDNPVLHQFYEFNSALVPNWTGHFFLSFFQFFLPAFLAEKAVLVLLLVGMAYAFRSLIKVMTPGNYMFSYLIFPFTYSFVFFLGFYNFCFGLIFLFITLAYWIRIEKGPISAKRLIFLFLLFTATYFSHAFVFAFLLLFMGLRVFVTTTINLARDSEGRKEVFRKFLLTSGGILLAVGFPLILFLLYISSVPELEKHYLETSTLIEWLEIVRPIIGLNFEVETKIAEILYISYWVLIGLIIYTRLITLRYRKQQEKEKRFIDGERLTNSLFWIVAFVVSLYVYFTMADGDANAGEVSVRIVLIVFLVFILWLSTQRLHPIIVGVFAIITLYCNVKLNNFYTTQINVLSYIAKDCEEVGKYIKPNSTVLPVNYSNHWMLEHYSNYLGIDKPMVILENYECTNAYFPLKWNDASMPNLLLGGHSSEEFLCLGWRSNDKGVAKNIDYVFILGKEITENLDACHLSVKQAMSDSYEMVFSNENCQLLKYKK